MKKYGNLYIVLTTIITINFWILSKGDLTLISNYPLKLLSQILALIGTIFLSFEYILATRFHFLENLFGGMDKLYKTHQFLGGLGFVLILNHPLLLIVNALPQTKVALIYIIPSIKNIPYALGILALLFFIILIITTLYIRLPYDLWKITHNFMGLPLLLFSAHVFLIPSDTTNYLPLRFWILGFIFIALVSYLYKRFLYEKFGPVHLYEIASFKKHPGILEIELKPKNKKIRYSPGQFVFIKIKDKRIGTEIHPYSIVSAPHENNLKLAIKVVGDYTSRLFNDLTPGIEVSVYGPHGKLSDSMLISNKEMLWIAGGIGITPFLSMLKHEVSQDKNRNVHLYYCVKTPEEAIYQNEIVTTVSGNTHIEYCRQCSKTDGRLCAEKIVKDVGNVKNKNIFLCGPKAMMEGLTKQFINLGVHPRNIIFEDFSLV